MVLTNNIETLSKQAREAIKERNWQVACEAYQKALVLKADQPDVHYGLATVYYQLNDLANAAHHFKEVVRLDPQRANAFINLGAIHNVLGQHDEAVAALRQGIHLDPQRVEGYYNLGLVYRRMGQVDMAVQAYREALRLNPRMADAQLNLANIYLEKSQYRQAVHHYELALAVRPEWPKASEGLVRAREGMAEEQQPGTPLRLVPTFDVNNPIDPVAHQAYLLNLYQAAAAAEEAAMRAEENLLRELEPAIKELSSTLLYPDRSSGELHERLLKFEAAIQALRSARTGMHEQIARLERLAERFPSGA
jgi:tetratricopeptide (TPR) repeat protein